MGFFRKHTIKSKKKISEGVKNNLPSTAYKKGHPATKTTFKKGNPAWNKNKEYPSPWLDKHRFKGGQTPWNKGIKGYMAGSKHYNWQNGKSFEPYGIEFNRELKEKIRQRDGYRCQECFRHQDELYTKSGKKYKLSIHHIDYNKKNNNPKNLISLCIPCHLQTNYGREDWTDYFSEKLKGVRTNGLE